MFAPECDSGNGSAWRPSGRIEFHDEIRLNRSSSFALGIVRTIKSSSASGGRGNTVLDVGAKTGRDGIHGATMASASLTPRLCKAPALFRWAIPFWKSCARSMSRGDAKRAVEDQDMGAAV